MHPGAAGLTQNFLTLLLHLGFHWRIHLLLPFFRLLPSLSWTRILPSFVLSSRNPSPLGQICVMLSNRLDLGRLLAKLQLPGGAAPLRTLDSSSSHIYDLWRGKCKHFWSTQKSGSLWSTVPTHLDHPTISGVLPHPSPADAPFKCYRFLQRRKIWLSVM